MRDPAAWKSVPTDKVSQVYGEYLSHVAEPDNDVLLQFVAAKYTALRVIALESIDTFVQFLVANPQIVRTKRPSIANILRWYSQPRIASIAAALAPIDSYYTKFIPDSDQTIEMNVATVNDAKCFYSLRNRLQSCAFKLHPAVREAVMDKLRDLSAKQLPELYGDLLTDELRAELIQEHGVQALVHMPMGEPNIKLVLPMLNFMKDVKTQFQEILAPIESVPDSEIQRMVDASLRGEPDTFIPDAAAADAASTDTAAANAAYTLLQMSAAAASPEEEMTGWGRSPTAQPPAQYIDFAPQIQCCGASLPNSPPGLASPNLMEEIETALLTIPAAVGSDVPNLSETTFNTPQPSIFQSFGRMMYFQTPKCDCATTGVCTCAPGTCNCEACPCAKETCCPAPPTCYIASANASADDLPPLVPIDGTDAQCACIDDDFDFLDSVV